MSVRRLAGTAILLSVAALSVTVLLRFAPAPTERSTSAASPTPSVLFTSPGDPRRYRVAMDSSMRFGTRDAAPGASVRVRLRGRLDVSTLEVADGEALVGMQLSSIRLTLSGESDPRLRQALAAPFRVRFGSGAVPRSFEFPASASVEARAMLESLVRTFQVTLPADATGPTWEVGESGMSGRHEALYRRVSPTRLEKRKRGFTAAADAPLLSGASISSTESIRLDPGRDWLGAMRVDEVLEGSEDAPPLQIVNRARLESSPDDVHGRPASHWRFAAEPPSRSAPPAPAATLDLPAEAVHRRLADELSLLDAATRARTPRIHAFRDLLRADDSAPAALLELMRTRDPGDRTRADLYLALELAGTPAAQTALTTVVDDPEASPKDGLRATVALAGVGRPEPATLEALWRTAESDRATLAGTAAFALGSLGRTLRGRDDAAYPALRDALLGHALGASDAQRRSDFVRALGNTRDPDLAADVALLLEDPAASVRRAAALSLETLGSARDGARLAARLAREPSGAVRAAIAESLGALPVADASSVAAVGRAVRDEPDEAARLAMVEFLGARLARYPEHGPTLRALARREPSRRVRQSIGEALAASR